MLSLCFLASVDKNMYILRVTVSSDCFYVFKCDGKGDIHMFLGVGYFVIGLSHISSLFSYRLIVENRDHYF